MNLCSRTKRDNLSPSFGPRVFHVDLRSPPSNPVIISSEDSGGEGEKISEFGSFSYSFSGIGFSDIDAFLSKAYNLMDKKNLKLDLRLGNCLFSSNKSAGTSVRGEFSHGREQVEVKNEKMSLKVQDKDMLVCENESSAQNITKEKKK